MRISKLYIKHLHVYKDRSDKDLRPDPKECLIILEIKLQGTRVRLQLVAHLSRIRVFATVVGFINVNVTSSSS